MCKERLLGLFEAFIEQIYTHKGRFPSAQLPALCPNLNREKRILRGNRDAIQLLPRPF